MKKASHCSPSSLLSISFVPSLATSDSMSTSLWMGCPDVLGTHCHMSRSSCGALVKLQSWVRIQWSPQPTVDCQPSVGLPSGTSLYAVLWGAVEENKNNKGFCFTKNNKGKKTLPYFRCPHMTLLPQVNLVDLGVLVALGGHCLFFLQHDVIYLERPQQGLPLGKWSWCCSQAVDLWGSHDNFNASG